MYPGAQSIEASVIQSFYDSYIRTYIERDIRLFADISDLQTFGRFVKLCAALTANEINYSHLGRELGLTPQTAKRWSDILQPTYQWYEVPAYSGNSIKRISGKPKGYICDTGITCHSLMMSSSGTIGNHPQSGAIFETFIAAEIRKMISLDSVKAGMYHWRTHGGAEVDIVLERDGILYPIEIKLTTSPSRRDTTGISAFRETYNNMKIALGLVIAPVEKIMKISENDYAMPYDFLG